MTISAIRQQAAMTLDKNNIALDNGVVGKVYKKGTKGNKNYVLSVEELSQRKEDVVVALGGEEDNFDTCVRTLVDLMKEEGDTVTQIAFRCYVVCMCEDMLLF